MYELDQEVALISSHKHSHVGVGDVRVSIHDDEYDEDYYKNAVSNGIINDEDDDFRILDSLPVQLGFKAQAVEKPQATNVQPMKDLPKPKEE